VAAWRQDLNYTFRRLFKTPGFVLAVLFSIGLGIAANSTIFAMVSRFVLRPAPVGDPGTLMSLRTTEHGECCNGFPWPVYTDVRDQAKSFSGLAADFDLLPVSIGGGGEPERVWGQAATANYFEVAQLPMAIGRGFLSGEENMPVIILGHGLWQRRFGADPAIAGKSIIISGHPFTVIGVAPASFHSLDVILDPQFWVPLGNVEQLALNIPSRNARGQNWLEVIGRLQPGVTRSHAGAELNGLAQRFAKAYPETDKDRSFRFEQAGSLPPRDKTTVIMFLTVLSVVVFLVLCIACANVANLLLAQAVSRRREMAIRLALGAARIQLLRQMLMESTLLAIGGGLVGVMLSILATQGLSAFRLPAPVPLDLSVTVDWRVLLYTFFLSVGAGLLFGFVPSWIASRPMLINALKGEDALARPGRRWTLRNVLVISQIAMSLILLCATGLFLRSLRSAADIDIGFRSRGLLMMSVDPRVHGYSAARTAQFLNQLRQNVATLPGVTSAVCTDTVPLSGGNRSDDFSAVGQPLTDRSYAQTEMYMATPGYFEAMGIGRVAGRDFGNESATGPKVAVVNQVFAKQLFANESPIGQQVTGGGATYQIIGVVNNIKSRSLGEELRPVLFRSLEQTVSSDPSFMGYTLLIRYEGNSAMVAAGVRSEIHSLDPTLAIFGAQTMEEHMRDAFFLPRLAGTLFGVFGGVGLVLAVVGLYGVMSYSVSRRTREIGIRMALGAQVGAVQRLVVRQGMVLALIAIALGLPAALGVAKFSSSFLYGVRPHDPLTFTAVPLCLAAVALLACWIPSRRAARVDPQTVLRYE
jgi:predicted permease